MIRKYVWNGVAFVERQRSAEAHHAVWGDITHKGGRRQWREHLKATGAVEMGVKDMENAREKWNSRQADHAAKVKAAQRQDVKPIDAPQGEIRDYERTELGKRVANRLDGRPMPNRIELLKMTLREARERR